MKENAFIVFINQESRDDIWEEEEKLAEMRELVLSSGCNICAEVLCNLKEPNPRTYIGSGKVNEIAESAREKKADVVIFSNDLSATQQQNIEDEISIKTIDRTQLILDIFAHHAKSLDGKLQVELAQHVYLLPRLKGKGVLLSRLGGGIGTRGPGEKKLEIDRRRIREHIKTLNKRLKEVKERRSALRKRRAFNEMPTIAIVGYTNAGKTTLLNLLTLSKQVASSSMFTTLDPVSRLYYLPGRQKVLFADTVGFLNQLPHHLIEAFKATLEEIIEAHLIIHVLDISHPMALKREKSVYDVLSEIGIKDKPTITVLNKIDMLTPEEIDEKKYFYPEGVFISAKKMCGIDSLVDKIKEEFYSFESRLDIFIPEAKRHLLDIIPAGNMIEKIPKDNGLYIKARVNLATRERFYRELSK